jgi:hypothetical protein
MIKTTNAQFLKYVVGMMMIINMSSMPPKVIKKKTCLSIRGLFNLSKDFEFNKHPNISRKEESKEIRDFIKMKKGGVHHKRYNDHCTKQ